MRKAAIVILNFNGRSVLEEFLPSVVSHSFYPIIVADNCSTDDSLTFLNQEYPSIKRIEMPINNGYAGGYNQALHQLEGSFEYFILLNSDVQVGEKWDQKLIQQLEENSDFSALQPKILSYKNSEYFDYAGAGGGFIDFLGYPYCRGRIFDTIEKDKGQYDDFIEVDWASGACMVLKASDFHAHGGFDESFFAHMEEVDYCWRLKKKGRKIGYFGKVAVLHLGGGTLPKSDSKKTFLNFRNNLRMLKKNSSKRDFRKIYRWRLLLDSIAAIKFLLEGKYDHAKSILEAHQNFNKCEIVKDHNFESLSIGVKSQLFSIVYAYYFKNKKTYNEL